MTRHISDKKVRGRWVKAAADVLEFKNVTSDAIMAGAPSETVKLCMFASLVPKICADDYMQQMTALHNELAAKFPQMISTRPNRRH